MTNFELTHMTLSYLIILYILQEFGLKCTLWVIKCHSPAVLGVPEVREDQQGQDDQSLRLLLGHHLVQADPEKSGLINQPFSQSINQLVNYIVNRMKRCEREKDLHKSSVCTLTHSSTTKTSSARSSIPASTSRGTRLTREARSTILTLKQEGEGSKKVISSYGY